MFLTDPSFKQFLPEALYGRGKEGYRAVILSTEAPWFLFTFRQKYPDGYLPQTIAVAWDNTLEQVIESVPVEERLSVMCMTMVPLSAEWSVHPAREVWTHVEGTGQLLFRFGDSEVLHDAFLTPHVAKDRGRLLYQAEPSAH